MRLPAAISLLALLALGACATGDGSRPAAVGNPDPITPTERYAIQVQPQVDEVRLMTQANGLSAHQAAALDDFVHRWIDAEGGEIVVRSPDHGDDPASAYRTAVGARDLLVSHGVPPHKVHITGYDSGDDHHAPIVVGFTRYIAHGPACGRAWENLTATKENREYDNFGCSVTANIAAQVANPADLLRPRDSDPPDAGRRQTVLDHYRKGDVTSTTKDEQSNGTLSTAVQ